MESMEVGLPCARQEGLLQEAVLDGLVLYDTERHRAYTLNQTAALVWQHCDGKTSISDMTALLQRHEMPSDEEVVWLALDRLGKAHLLEKWQRRSETPVSRRAVMKKLGMAGGLIALLPVVESIIAPTPAQAQSPGVQQLSAILKSGVVSKGKAKGP
jgi:hypothetical protein